MGVVVARVWRDPVVLTAERLTRSRIAKLRTAGGLVRRIGWGTMVLLATGVTLYALAGAFVPEMRSPFVSDLFDEKALRAFGHLAAGGIALFAGALQFSNRLRWERPRVHRLLGKIYLIVVLVSGLSALLLAPSSTGGLPAHFGFGMLATLWLGTSAIAFGKVRKGDYASHRAWMIRSFALCLAAVSLRVQLPISQMLGLPFEEAYPTIAWLCWVPNLVIAEWVVIKSAVAPLARPTT
jgi:uncharacterized membrane protein